MPSMEQFGTALQGMGAGLQGNGVAFQQVMVNRQKEKREAEMQRKQTGYIDAYTGLQMAEAGDWQAVAELSANRLADLQNVGGVESKQTETVAMLSRIAVGDDPEAAATAKVKLMSTLGNYSKIGEAFGILKIPKKEKAQSPIGKILADQEAAGKRYGFDSAEFKAYDQIMEDQRAGKLIGPVSLKDFTAESGAAYLKSKDPSDLVRYKQEIVEVSPGVFMTPNTLTNNWELLFDANDPSITKQATAVAEIEASRQSRLDFTTAQSKWRDGEATVLSSIGAAEGNQTVINDTVSEIKKRVNGWSTKYGAMLSEWPGAEAQTLAGLVDTITANSALTTLTDLKKSGGTLGAISEAELVLLKAKLGSLNQKGDSVEFLRVLDQIVAMNTGSVTRMRNSYDMSSERYSGSYDDSLIQNINNTKEPQKAMVDMSIEELQALAAGEK